MPNRLCAASDRHIMCHRGTWLLSWSLITPNVPGKSLSVLTMTTSNTPQFLEGIRDPHIRMPPGFWAQMMLLLSQDPPPTEHSTIPRPSISYSTFAMFPEYIHNPHLHLSEITATYAVLQSDARRMYGFLDQDLFVSLPRIHQSRYRAAYTVVVTLALLLNTLLRCFDPTETILVQKSKFFCQQVIECADAASCDRPLGAAYVRSVMSCRCFSSCF